MPFMASEDVSVRLIARDATGRDHPAGRLGGEGTMTYAPLRNRDPSLALRPSTQDGYPDPLRPSYRPRTEGDIEDFFVAPAPEKLRPWASIWAKPTDDERHEIEDRLTDDGWSAEVAEAGWTTRVIVGDGEAANMGAAVLASSGGSDLWGWLEIIGVGVVVAALAPRLLKLGQCIRAHKLAAACSAALWVWAAVALLTAT